MSVSVCMFFISLWPHFSSAQRWRYILSLRSVFLFALFCVLLQPHMQLIFVWNCFSLHILHNRAPQKYEQRVGWKKGEDDKVWHGSLDFSLKRHIVAPHIHAFWYTYLKWMSKQATEWMCVSLFIFRSKCKLPLSWIIVVGAGFLLFLALGLCFGFGFSLFCNNATVSLCLSPVSFFLHLLAFRLTVTVNDAWKGTQIDRTHERVKNFIVSCVCKHMQLNVNEHWKTYLCCAIL